MNGRTLARWWVSLAAALGALLSVACEEPEPPRMAELELYEQAVSCDEEVDHCLDAAGQPAYPEYHRTQVTAGSGGSRYRQGLVVQLSLERPSAGVVGELFMDIPLVPVGADALIAPLVTYSEYSDADREFAATRVSGRIEVSADDDCPCQTGRFELLLVDAGPDGALDTDDDRQRRLSQARVQLDERPFCHRRAVMPVEGDGLHVGIRSCPTRRNAPQYGSFSWNEDESWQTDELWSDPQWAEGGWDDDGGWDWSSDWSDGDDWSDDGDDWDWGDDDDWDWGDDDGDDDWDWGDDDDDDDDDWDWDDDDDDWDWDDDDDDWDDE